MGILFWNDAVAFEMFFEIAIDSKLSVKVENGI